MEPNQPKNLTVPFIIGGSLLLFTFAAGAWAFASSNSNQTDSPNNSQLSSTTSIFSGNTTTNTSSSKYKNGTYASLGSYDSPGGIEQLGVSVTISNDIITDVSFIMKSKGTSGEYQQLYISEAKNLIVGKTVDSDFNFSSVNGASLTNEGFISALANIKSQAKA